MKLERLMGTRSRIALLRHLCRHPEQDFSIVELADAVRIHKSLVSRVVQDLERQKVVVTRERRNLKLCQINRRNVSYRMLSEVFASEKRLNGK